MSEAERIAAELKRGDAKLLDRVIATNGGGVWGDLIPRAQYRRMAGLGLLRPKSAGSLRHDPETGGIRILGVHGLVIHGPHALAVRDILKREADNA